MGEKISIDLLWTWIINPRSFFTQSMGRLARTPKKIQFLVYAGTLSIPILNIVFLTMLAMKTAVSIIISTWLPVRYQFIAFFGLFFVLTLITGIYYLLLVPARRFRDSTGGKAECRIPRFSLLNLTRNNTCFLPAMVVTGCMFLSMTSFSWNTFQLGTYLTTMYWVYLLWTTWLIISSIRAYPSMFPERFDENIVVSSRWNQARIAAIMLGTFIVGGSIILNFIASLYIGGEHVPLFFKIAYLLMHGN